MGALAVGGWERGSVWGGVGGGGGKGRGESVVRGFFLRLIGRWVCMRSGVVCLAVERWEMGGAVVILLTCGERASERACVRGEHGGVYYGVFPGRFLRTYEIILHLFKANGRPASMNV